MKQIALSLFVIASSGAYVWSQAGSPPADDLIDVRSPTGASEQSLLPRVVPPAPAFPASAPAARLPNAPRQNARQELTQDKPGEFKTDPVAAAAPKPATAANPPPPAPKRNPTLAAASVEMPEAPSFAVTPAVYVPVPQPRPEYSEAPAHVVRTGVKLAAHGYVDGVYAGPAADAYYGIIQLQALVQGGRLTALKILRYPNDRRTSVNINRQALPMLRDEAIAAQSADVDIISGATLTSKAFIQSLRGALRKAS
ncbi:FMN-binding protein [Mesorhizobium sp. M1C.F.Ca.ET.193.01.1.1]|uniref:FMN-binding protein n=1 Tax=unclassified Mesorhizobium TaxID=325217 RepID=UPI000FD323A3|nr:MULTISPECIES: FMN-binding protein [unclassified Mesorhizobium]TGS99057.1 FMN-binding protein [bacterium M00.F.Ca.ET.177.01.1.1]TGQ53095.1 FMN-binding protein [Mesorhizobium sp. M1C.F.Ca.ET.210.01.1.1]TGQ70372.1 FMN-binding protein [Mesorhizobium sp. M1C.F.Ca.ET.212.01.1.1]TGR06703.1 FMN-binding protein [Mesorhizobium sp. M1C.F.Ca.ET.204.01.1.1]TGR27226.1 FMN-binding protein [Mesorhizobium sp. M1C.F.Ca.ET.196.01.1.1]